MPVPTKNLLEAGGNAPWFSRMFDGKFTLSVNLLAYNDHDETVAGEKCSNNLIRQKNEIKTKSCASQTRPWYSSADFAEARRFYFCNL